MGAKRARTHAAPSKALVAATPTNKGGRPTRLLEPGVQESLVASVELGLPVMIACAAVGIAEQSFRNWMHRGAGEHECRADPTWEPIAAEQPFVDLYLAIQLARSKSAARNMANIQKAGAGGVVTAKTTRRYRDHEGNLVEEETVQRTAPDWRASAWHLERAHPSEFGKHNLMQVEVNAGSTPGKPEEPVTPPEDLAKRLAEHREAGVVAIGPSWAHDADDDVHDADVVEA